MEDVLSSVQRLVSDAGAKDVGATPPDKPDVLILSPEQRVRRPGVLRLGPDAAVHVPTPGSDGPSENKPPVSEARSPALDALSQKIALLEVEIAKTAGQWEPDGTGGDDYAGTETADMTWPEEDAAEAPASGAVQAGRSQELTTPQDDQVLDEETLQRMISEILRAELQGEMGERITQNLRKMVRREIQRALSTRDLG
ncbi:hypothetical protein [Roseobacter cerasinus]|uniref:hypothetical protein n=1 Tax=Roseobacter cerasinus TaxID=2602289 RepID=UPI00135B6215|nr:hypothetical protein [Roseobacter cerasinus]